MATSTENQTTHHAMNNSVRVRVADIENDLTSNDADSKYIEAVVQLVWPFSSTTSQLSLLLIEKNVSLRDTTAQIRVTFHDACAKEVAQSKIGIGDILRLDLRGASAEAEHEELSTPGKKAGYDLHFHKNVNLQVRISAPIALLSANPDLGIYIRRTSQSPQFRCSGPSCGAQRHSFHSRNPTSQW